MKKILWSLALLFMVLLVAIFWQNRGSRKMNDPQTLDRIVGAELLFDSDGLVDYVAMLNSLRSRDVQPAENAFIDYARILGPLSSSPARWETLCRLLQVDPIICERPLDVRTMKEFQWRDLDYANRLAQAFQRPWTSDEFPEVGDWLDRNAEQVALIRAAAEKKQFFFPLIPSDDSRNAQVRAIACSLEHIDALREVARLMIAHAMHALAAGDAAEALADLTAVHALATQIASGNCTVEKLVAIAVNGQAFFAAGTLIAQETMSPELIGEYRRFLREHPWDVRLASAVSQSDRFMAFDAVQSIERWGPGVLAGTMRSESQSPNMIRVPRWAGTNWSIAGEVLSVQFDSIVDKLQIADEADRIRELKAFEDRLTPPDDNGFGMLGVLLGGPRVRGKALGQILACILMPAGSSLAAAEIRSQIQREMVDTGLAVAEYRLDNGRLPETLDQLVPQYLAAVPRDRFAGHPLTYRIFEDGFELVSVGHDGAFNDEAPPESLKDIRLIARSRTAATNLNGQMSLKFPSSRRFDPTTVSNGAESPFGNR